MKKEDFLKLGLTEEQADAAALASQEELKGYVEKSKFDEEATTNEALKEQLKNRDSDIAQLKKAAGGNEELSKQYEDLQVKYKSETEAFSKKLSENAKSSAIDMAILQAKGKNPKAIKALLDMEKINVQEDGTLEGLDLEGLMKTDGYLFDTETTVNIGNGFIKGSATDTAAELSTQIAQAMGVKTI